MLRALLARLAAAPEPLDVLLHPDLAGLSQRALADLPFEPAPGDREPAVLAGRGADARPLPRSTRPLPA